MHIIYYGGLAHLDRTGVQQKEAVVLFLNVK